MNKVVLKSFGRLEDKQIAINMRYYFSPVVYQKGDKMILSTRMYIPNINVLSIKDLFTENI